MKTLLRYLPQTLVGRVFALYSAGLLTFTLTGLGLFYYHQFTEVLADAHESAAMLTEVISPTITDSAVIGDYDTVNRTLEKVLFRSVYASAAFIDVGGGVVRAETKRSDPAPAPAWLQFMVMRRMFDVNRVIAVGGRDYGVLRLQLSPAYIAGEIWKVTRVAVALAAACFALGISLIRSPLRRWLGNLDRIRAYEWEFQDGSSLPQELLSSDAPLEIRQTFDVLTGLTAGQYAQGNRVTSSGLPRDYAIVYGSTTLLDTETATTITFAANPVTVSDTAVVSVTVGPGGAYVPTGTVTLTVGSDVVTRTLVNGTAVYTSDLLLPNSYLIQAV